MLTLAKATGWSEEFLVWRLRLWRFEQYWHAHLWAENCWTVPLDETPPSNDASVEDQVTGLFGDWSKGV